MSLSYRIRQFRSAVHACITPAEYDLVRRLLTPAEQRLFDQMPRYDQRHCLDVYYTLVDAAEQDEFLLRAALYHDCGKVDDHGRPMALGWYVLATILKRWPALYLIAARFLPPIALYAGHAARGAQMAAAAGCPPEIVETIRHYHDPNPRGRAARLQWADEQN
ncbi:HDIG domain-containing metalloprotein [Chloroflexus sp.]|uniref:HDIG domain-containing metalloprotein n=1 Tax=Chloroflexus sp. TaxID=1904827 RepID=UPI002ADD9307|nr:HDIG domain-containing metalloprotein [Chloroflexus sp.]